MKKRVFLIVLDSFGVGELPDAAAEMPTRLPVWRNIATLPRMRFLVRDLFRILGLSKCKMENAKCKIAIYRGEGRLAKASLV